jgi:hypothetical protein
VVAHAAGVEPLVARDPEQPRQRRLAPGAEAPGADQGGGERLGRQIGGQLGVARAVAQEREDRALVAAVEDRERGGLGRRQRQQPVVAEVLHTS